MAEEQKKNLTVAIIISAVIFLGGFLVCHSCSEPKDWKTSDNTLEAYTMMSGFVKERLKSPSSAKFPSAFDIPREEQVTKLDNYIYQIDSTVESQNSFGAMIRSRFKGKVQQVDESNWKLIELKIY